MKLNRVILKEFLESEEWNNENTLNIFDKIEEDNINNISKLNSKLTTHKENYVILENITESALNNYKKSIDAIKVIKNEYVSLLNELYTEIKKLKDDNNYLLNKEQFFFEFEINNIKNLNITDKDKCKIIIELFHKYKRLLLIKNNDLLYNSCLKLISLYPKTKNYTILYYKLLEKSKHIIQ